MASYDESVAELYQAPHAAFVTERKRLAGELKAAGDKAGATKLGKLPRPPISAWAVNQLWWHARDAFEAMLESAERLREGTLAASGEHREAIAKLRARAASILEDAGNAAAESTLRRVTTTLAAIAATGSFDPDPPGALGADRDPPGFEAIGIAAEPVERAKPAAKAEKAAKNDNEPEPEEDRSAAEEKRAAADAKRRREAEEAAERAEAAAERRRAEQEEAKRLAERHRTEAALRTAIGEVERRAREADRLRTALTEAEEAIGKAQAVVTDLEARLVELAD
jgi:flagellar biosynthesis GTPase FlhF